MVSGEILWWSVIFVNHQVNGQWVFRFCPPPQIFHCDCDCDFLGAVFENTIERLLLEQCFSYRDLVIRPWGLLQAPSLLNNNSFVKTFLPRSTIWLYAIIVTFCIWYLSFVYRENNETNKQRNKCKSPKDKNSCIILPYLN